MKKLSFILLFSFIHMLSFGQALVDNPCNLPSPAGAQWPLDGVCYATSTAGFSALTNPGTCNAGNRDDGWAWFVGDGNNITVTYNPDASFDAILHVYSAVAPCTVTQIGCSDNIGNGVSETVTITPSVAGQVYFVRIQRFNSNNTMTGCLSVTSAGGGGCPNCANGIQDCAETGIDCGGPDCPPCSMNCTDNNDCTSPAPITLNPSGGADVCINDCNTGASPGPNFPGNNCYDLPNSTVWYSITTDATASTIDITLTSGTMSTTPEFTVFTNVCGPYTIVNCTEGAGGTASATGIPVAANTTYIIAVSNVNGSAGTFNLCVAQDPDNSACNTDNTFVMTSSSMGSPQGGPYQPGEQVNFCYTLTNWQQINCNYIGAFVPSFGNCWDPASFDAQGMPVNITTPLAVNGVIQPCPPCPPGPPCGPCAWSGCVGQPAGSWVWFPAGTATYNVNGYYPAGTPMPAGWYFLSSYDPITGNCTPTPTDPNNTYGDGNFPACGTNTFNYTICFTLIAGSDPNNNDCFVGMKTFADGEFGAWNNIGCTVDALALISGVLPVTLSHFDAKYNSKTSVVELVWITSSEINNDFFTIEKSIDGETFEVVGIVKGAGNSSEIKSYNSLDKSPYIGTSYYRLKQTDFDGSFEYSDLVPVDVEGDISNPTIYPNPITNNGVLEFSTNSTEVTVVTIYDVSGRIILSNQHTTNKGINKIQLETTALTNGMYFISLKIGNNKTNLKFIKE